MLVQIKQRIVAAMKSGDNLTRNILKVALGDLQLDETRKGGALTPEECEKTVRKILKGIGETLAAELTPEMRTQLEGEKAILESLLPKNATEEEITAALAPVADAIRAAGNDGQATGVAMKQLKVAGLTVQAPVVGVVVRTLRAK